MSQKIQSAVIMAAGMGTRLKHMGTQAPKGFLQLGDQPIIEESLQRLRNEGINQIVIVTGHLDHFYENLKDKYPGLITTVHNNKYAESGSMYSLYLARETVQGSFLLLESDLIYEQRALSEALAFGKDNVVMLSGTTHSGDEVYVQCKNGLLVNMSKNRTLLEDNIAGELVGISKISNDLYTHMINYAEKRFTSTLHVDYETDCLVGVAAHYPVYCHTIDDLLWSEIDDASHLERASKIIYPVISNK